MIAILEPVAQALREGKPARTVEFTGDDLKLFKQQQLLTSKPVLYVCNVGEEDAATGNDYTAAVAQMAADEGAPHIVISAEIESEIAQLSTAEDKAEFLEGIGLEEAGLAACSAPAMAFLSCSPFSPLALRRRGLGPFATVQPHQTPQV